MRLLVCALIFVVNLPTTIATSTYCDTDGLARLRPWAAILLIREWGVPWLTSTRSLLPLEEHLSLRQMAWMSLRFRGRRDFGIFAKRTTAFRFLRRVLPFRTQDSRILSALREPPPKVQKTLSGDHHWPVLK
jgi:hypothetical protein